MFCRCKRLIKLITHAEFLLRWVTDEADLSGNMELDAALRAYWEDR